MTRGLSVRTIESYFSSNFLSGGAVRTVVVQPVANCRSGTTVPGGVPGGVPYVSIRHILQFAGRLNPG